MSIGDSKKIMAALQRNAVVNHQAETYAFFAGFARIAILSGRSRTSRHAGLRTVFGTVEVRNPRWMLCRECDPGIVGAFAPLKEICGLM
ncbi:hypothetical protein NKH48_06125 [Mesorhizobium sp. M1233]|uniref:hypothetical protein n=1 Tax=Mesorhizobium sp. M1233 TaxID=2957072 RepID=UPI003336FD0A